MGGFFKSEDLFPGEMVQSNWRTKPEKADTVLSFKRKDLYSTYKYTALAREEAVLFCMKCQPYLHSGVQFACRVSGCVREVCLTFSGGRQDQGNLDTDFSAFSTGPSVKQDTKLLAKSSGLSLSYFSPWVLEAAVLRDVCRGGGAANSSKQ